MRSLVARSVGGLAAASFGHPADIHGIETVYRLSALLPLVGLLTIWLPDARRAEAPAA